MSVTWLNFFLNNSLQEIISHYFIEGKIFAQMYKFSNKKKILPAWNYFKIKNSRPLSRKTSVCFKSFLNKIE